MWHSAKACLTFLTGRPKKALKETMASTSSAVNGLHCVEHSHFLHYLSDSSWAHPVGTCLWPVSVAESLSGWALATTHSPSLFTGMGESLTYRYRLPHKSKALWTSSVTTFPKIRFCFKFDGA